MTHIYDVLKLNQIESTSKSNKRIGVSILKYINWKKTSDNLDLINLLIENNY